MRQDESTSAPTRTFPSRQPAAPLLVALALGIVYLVWGSTYLAIRIVVRDLPPLSSAGWRFACGAALLAALLASVGGVRRLRATRRQLAGCALLGLLLPAGGNGLVTVGEHRGVPSGVAALLVATTPLWVIVYRAGSGDRPSHGTTLGVLLGFAGLVGLVGASGVQGDIPIGASLIIVLAASFWSFGSWVMPSLPLPGDSFVVAVYEMAFGAVFLLMGGAVSGERMLPFAAPAHAWLAWAYLVVFGSVVAFTAYVWVLDVAPISLVATYAYVNPVVAVLLGWWVLAEPVTLPIRFGGAVVIVGVALVVASERQPRRPVRRHSA